MLLPSPTLATPLTIELNISGTITILSRWMKIVPTEVHRPKSQPEGSAWYTTWKTIPTATPSTIAIRICQ